MPVNKDDIAQMAGFMRALNAPEQHEPGIQLSEQNQPSSGSMRSGSIDQTATQDMKLILERFYTAADNAADIVNDQATYDRELREALHTEETPGGSRIGNWEITIREEGRRKFYNVGQGEVYIASDLLLYEAAQGLVRILNNGGRLNSPQAINLLRLEQVYASALNDAVLYKHYLVKHSHDPRLAVFEARYSAAKHRAITARDRIFNLIEA
jgi:hypothetical protein